MSDDVIAEAERRKVLRAKGLPLHGTADEQKHTKKIQDDRLEREVQAEVYKMYRAHGFVVRVLVQYRRSKIAPGIADLYCVNPRTKHVIWHEAKAASGRQSPAQKVFQEDHVGTPVHYVIGGEREADAKLRELGFMD